MSKFLYPIYKLKTKSYIKWWLYHKKAGGSGVLSEILEGFSFNLENTLNRKFNLFEIEGNSVQDGTPSPDNEVPIKSAGDNGSINEKIQTRNLWSSVWEQGYINANGVNENNSDLIRTKDYIYFEPEQHYAIKRSIFNNYINVRGYDINKKFIGAEENVINLYQGNTANNPMQPTIQTCVIATKPGVYYLRFNDASNNLSTEYMMVKGDTPEDYIPHEEQDYSIFVQQPMRSIGDVRDCFVKKSDGWYERHKIFEMLLDGTENWNSAPRIDNTTRFFTYSPPSDKRTSNTASQITVGELCNKFIQNNPYTEIGNYFWIYDNGNTSFLRIGFDNQDINTADKFKTWLSNNNVKVYYQLKEPLDLPCTEEQIEQLENLPSTYKDFTYVVSEDETPAYLKIQYYKEG